MTENKDMKSCIKKFIKRAEELEAEEDPDGNGFHKEYRRIHEEQIKNKRDNKFKSDVGKQEANLKKNRYKDILPYDDHRVKLNVINDDEGSDYINASNLMGVKGSGGYIASQGPLASTVNDFWRLIWEKEVEIVFMACRTVELGKIKCKQYWHDLHCSDDFGDINVFTEEEENISTDFTRRSFKVTCGEEVRKVKQYHYSGWPDHGVPNDPAHIRDLMSLMRKERLKDKSPLLTHCSAGCGRTGAIVAIDYVWTLLEEGKFDDKFDLYELICKFREQRMSIVQTPDQYALVYKVLKSLCEEWIAKMASHTYVNVSIEDEFVNVNDGDTEEDHIYENSEVLEEEASEDDGKKEDKVPEIVELPQVPARKADDSNSTQALLYSNGPVTNTKPPQDAEAEQAPKEVLHKTVIQIGGGAPSSSGAKQKPPPSPSVTEKLEKGKRGIMKAFGFKKGNKQEVVNLITSGTATTRRAVTLPREATHPDLYTAIPRSKSTSSASSATSAARRDRLQEVDAENLEDIPGFPDRLPKVKGPIPEPQTWRKTS